VVATSKLLLRRNEPMPEPGPEKLGEPVRFGFDDPLGRFDIPEGFEKPTPYNVSRYWVRCLKEAGKWPGDWSGFAMGLRAAKVLLEEYPYEDVLRAVRFWAGALREGRGFSLWWLRDNMQSFYDEYKPKKCQTVNDFGAGVTVILPLRQQE